MKNVLIIVKFFTGMLLYTIEKEEWLYMNLPRFKETKIGQPSSAMNMSEYEESVRSIERRNRLKRTFNNLLDIIDKPDKDR